MNYGDSVSKLSVCDCGHSEFEELSGGGGAEMHRCGWCGDVYNVGPFAVEKLFPWNKYAARDHFPLPRRDRN